MSLAFSLLTDSQPVKGGVGRGICAPSEEEPNLTCFRYKYDPSTSTIGKLDRTASRTLHVPERIFMRPSLSHQQIIVQNSIPMYMCGQHSQLDLPAQHLCFLP